MKIDENWKTKNIKFQNNLKIILKLKISIIKKISIKIHLILKNNKNQDLCKNSEILNHRASSYLQALVAQPGPTTSTQPSSNFSSSSSTPTTFLFLKTTG